ncbi:hypothetical protein DW657_07465 [Prevotella sp. AM23-5]|nr:MULTISPECIES: hypothetical protein [Prevotellaceae]RHN96128.1 hypothetical protein DW657_07465 [Prevotella sp. AM23-5]
MPVNLVQDFKDAGYKISLIFFGLSSKEDSLSRVIQRYTMGGHNVNQDVIEYNFTEGIKRVRASLPLFENILFIDGTSDFGDIVAIHIEKSLPFWQQSLNYLYFAANIVTNPTLARKLLNIRVKAEAKR